MAKITEEQKLAAEKEAAEKEAAEKEAAEKEAAEKEAAEKEAAEKEAAEKEAAKTISEPKDAVTLKNTGNRSVVMSRRPGFDQKILLPRQTVTLTVAEFEVRKAEVTIAHMLETGELEIV